MATQDENAAAASYEFTRLGSGRDGSRDVHPRIRPSSRLAARKNRVMNVCGR